MVYPVSAKTVDDVKRWNQVATEQDFSMYVSYDNVMLDLRSLLALFTIIGKRCVVVAPDHANPEAFNKALKRMGVIA